MKSWVFLYNLIIFIDMSRNYTSNIYGDNNKVIQGDKNNVSQNKEKSNKVKLLSKLGLWIALATLIVTIIVGWDSILKFFSTWI